MDELSALKLKVACVCRLFHMAGLFDFSGHVSARIPGTDKILIHPRHTARPGVKAADILTVDLSGKVVDGKEQQPSETPIHTCIYRTRPDVLAVAHIHSHYATLLGISGQEFVPVTISGVMFTEYGVPIFPHSWNIGDEKKGMALAKALGQARAVLMRGHGSVAVAENLEGVFMVSQQLEKAARLQIEAMQIGVCRSLPDSEIKLALKESFSPRRIMKEWVYYEAIAERAGIYKGAE